MLYKLAIFIEYLVLFGHFSGSSYRLIPWLIAETLIFRSSLLLLAKGDAFRRAKTVLAGPLMKFILFALRVAGHCEVFALELQQCVSRLIHDQHPLRRLCDFPLAFLPEGLLRRDPLLQFENMLLIVQSRILELNLSQHQLLLELEILMFETSVFLHEGLHLLQHLFPLALRRCMGGTGGLAWQLISLGRRLFDISTVNSSDYGHYIVQKHINISHHQQAKQMISIHQQTIG